METTRNAAVERGSGCQVNFGSGRRMLETALLTHFDRL
jgi:hypothetical protein